MINLLFNFYITENEDRQAELDFCFITNINNPFINKIHCFITDKDYNLVKYKDSKIVFNIIEDRPTYYDLFKYANGVIPYNDLVVISNTDIYFDSSIRFANIAMTENDVYAITRWGADGNIVDGNNIKLYANAHCSQDAWIFRSKLTKLDEMDCNFKFGINGCDNRIAYEFHKVGYNITNPCLDIFIYHKHLSGYRTDTASLPGTYAYVKPSFLNENTES